MTSDERAHLSSIVSKASGSVLKEEVQLSFPPWVSLVLVFIFAWVFAAWVGRKFFGVNFGWNSDWAPAIFGAGVLFCALVMTPNVVKSTRSRSRALSKVRSDLAAGVVDEVELHFTGVKRFQESEHGGLMYFFLTREEEVFVLFDYKSQQLGVDGQDPLTSPFAPRRQLVLVRAPESRIVVRTTFSGEALPLASLLELTARPEEWPNSEDYCEIPWTQLEARLGAVESRFVVGK
jgi:hypothetical protein